MSQYRQLLLILSEVDPRSAALHRAVSLAKASEAALHVLGIFEQSELRLHDELRDPQVADASLNHFKKSFKDLMEELRDDSLQLTGEVMQAEDAHVSVLDYHGAIADVGDRCAGHGGGATPAMGKTDGRHHGANRRSGHLQRACRQTAEASACSLRFLS
ncbi:hypothetical protein [Pseudomonas sp. BBP2017]|uniref:hypothetical protein n=1 Tax=Pseudomonas sp. BBP2017 TaxID=2109731 RepID=UPI000D4A05FE|nr:hypothetical protein [Pseudomonas sp. BBP2017]PSS57904.1 hypothetical protein C6382_08475 [Pseudomonas sp. BBP2017]